ncbi:hypothetical protein Tco_1265647 [Tanacetum coccineum]
MADNQTMAQLLQAPTEGYEDAIVIPEIMLIYELKPWFDQSWNMQNQGQGTLPSQTVTNPRKQVNAITTRSGKTCEGLSTPLIPTPVVSTPLKEPGDKTLDVNGTKVTKHQVRGSTNVDIDEIDAFLAMEVSSNFEEGYYDSEEDVIFLESLLSDDTTHNLSPEQFFNHEPRQLRNKPENEPLIDFSPKSDPLHHEFAGELLTLPSRIVREHEEYLSLMTLLCEISTSQSPENVHANPNDLIPPGVEDDDSEDEDNSTFLPENELSILEPSSPRPPPEPPDVYLNFKPDTAMKNDEDFNQGEIVLSLNVEDVNSFTFVIWTFLLFFTYPEDSLFILSLRSKDLIFDPNISTFLFSLKPVPFALPKDK